MGQKSFFSVESVGVNGLTKEKYQGFIVGTDSIREGRYILYFDNGRVFQEGFYKNGKPDSVWITYYSSSARKSLFNYKSGEKKGSFTFWNSDGTLYQTGEYENNKLTDTLITYHSNGQIDSKSSYLNGLLNGISVVY
ncbi:MAG TPA: hypothetical protein PKW61_04115, partial [Tenuifilaceae bacterium]|nr:hypothetical protein [Tenuifilaceae bacterium]